MYTRIKKSAFTDPRLDKLTEFLADNRREAVGTLALLWFGSQSEMKTHATAEDIARWTMDAKAPSILEALVSAHYVEVVKGGKEFRIRGNSGPVGRLVRAAEKRGGKRKATPERSASLPRSKGKPTLSVVPTSTPMTVGDVLKGKAVLEANAQPVPATESEIQDQKDATPKTPVKKKTKRAKAQSPTAVDAHCEAPTTVDEVSSLEFEQQRLAFKHRGFEIDCGRDVHDEDWTAHARNNKGGFSFTIPKEFSESEIKRQCKQKVDEHMAKTGGPLPGKHRPSKEEKLQEQRERTPGVFVWTAYARAYRQRWNVNPIRNEKVNSQCAQLAKQVGLNVAETLVEYYVGRGDTFYVHQKHPIGVCLAQCQKLLTEMSTGEKMTIARASKAEKSQAVDEAMATYLSQQGADVGSTNVSK